MEGLTLQHAQQRDRLRRREGKESAMYLPVRNWKQARRVEQLVHLETIHIFRLVRLSTASSIF